MSDSGKLYYNRIQKVVTYIENNICEQLDLVTLANEAYFSRYHFHRIFTSIMDETPQDFVRRARLGRAAYILLHNPNISILEVAIKCGFSSSSVFSRAFKAYFGFSAKVFRETKGNIVIDNHGFNNMAIHPENHHNNYPDNFSFSDDSGVKIKMDKHLTTLDDMLIAYSATFEGYTEESCGKAWNTLCAWAEPNNMFRCDTKFIGISYDDPYLTPEDKCRYYACITIPEGTETGDQVDKMILQGGRFAVLHFEGIGDDIIKAYRYLYRVWLPTSGYVPEDRPSFEIYLKAPEEEPLGIYLLDIYLPVKPI